MHAAGRPRRQSAQSPHDGAHERTTSSPGFTEVTPSPTASTTPAPSWPSTDGRRPLPLAADRVQLRAADPDRRHPHEHVAGSGLLEVDLADLERPPGPVEDGGAGLHAPSAAATVLPSVTVDTFWSA